MVSDKSLKMGGVKPRTNSNVVREDSQLKPAVEDLSLPGERAVLQKKLDDAVAKKRENNENSPANAVLDKLGRMRVESTEANMFIVTVYEPEAMPKSSFDTGRNFTRNLIELATGSFAEQKTKIAAEIPKETDEQLKNKIKLVESLRTKNQTEY